MVDVWKRKKGVLCLVGGLLWWCECDDCVVYVGEECWFVFLSVECFVCVEMYFVD